MKITFTALKRTDSMECGGQTLNLALKTEEKHLYKNKKYSMFCQHYKYRDIDQYFI